MDMSPTSPKDGGTSPVQQQEQRPAPSPMPMSPDEVISEEDELKIPPHQPTPSPPPPPAVAGGSGTSSGEVVGGAVGGGNQPNMSPQQQDQLSPQVEEASIQQSLEQNKESLKRKLLLRRSVNELVDQGIYPPLKTPGAFAEQRKHLQRAQTGDLLKHKIQHRPDRQALVQQHILEDTNVAPSLQDRQRQLKRARLQDSLSDRIANRPGPLELVEDNILHTDPEIKHALKEGKLQYEKTAENAHAEDEDALFSDASSQSSASSSTNKTQKKSPLSSTSSVSIPSPPDITPFLQKLHQQQTSISSAISAASVVTASEASSVANISYAFTTTSNSASSRTCVSSPPTAASFSSRSPGSNSSIGSSTGKLNRTKKFTKPKASTSKNKTIKFHEYKGPPSVSKSNKDNEDHTPYHVMLQQQQLFLQWQLENKKPDGTTVLPMSVPFNMSGQQIITTNMTTPGIPAGQIITHAAVGNHATAVGTAVLTDAQGQAQIHAATPIIAAHPTAKIIQQVATGLVPQQKVLARPAQPGNTYTIHKHVATVMPAVHSAVQATPVQLQMAATPAAPATPLPVAAPPPPPPPLPPPPTTASVTASASAPPTTPVPPPAPPLPPAKKTIPSHTRPKCLEEMKVPELRAELKKRNLTVSGAKPQLIEKLRPYIDSIFGCTLTSGTSTPISNRTAVVSSGTSTSIATSPASSTTGPPSNNPSVSSSLASPASVQSSVGSVINIQPISPASSAATNDEAQTATSMISSPPISPVSSAAASESVSTTFKSMDTSSFADAQDGGVNLHLNASFGSLPSMLSGDQYSPGDSSMDVPSPLALTAGAQSAVNLNSSTGNIQSMLVDQQSRPSSVAPMDIEMTGTTLRDGNNKAVGATSSTLVSPPAPPPLPQQTTTGKRKQKKKQVTATAKQVMVPDSVGVFQQQPTVISAAQQQLSNQSTRVSQSVAVVDPMPQQMFTVSNASKTLDQQVTGTIERSAMNGDQQNQGNVAVNIQQQQQIEKLQRELHRTQMELQQAQHALKNQNRTQIVYQRHPLSHLPGIPASGTLDKNQQLQDIITHPPLTHPPPVMSQIQLHTPATSQPVTNTRLASSRSAQVRQIVGHLTSQAHLFIKPSLGSVVTTQGVGIPAGSSATIKQTLANYLRQNSSTQKAKTATSGTMTNSAVQGSGAGKKKTAKSRGIAPVSVTSSVNSVSMSSSVPSSPLHQTATTIHRSATNPLFMTEDVSNQQQTSDVSASKGGSAMTSPLGLAGDGAPTTVMDQPPPKYDEAIKSKQCMLLQQQAAAAAAALSGTLKSAPTGTAAGDGSSSFTNSPSPTHTDHTVEDVLEILIQSGELPATIASDDPALLIPKSEDEDEDPSGDNLSSAASLMNSADIPDSLHSLNISDMSALSSHHNQATDPAFNMHLADSGIFDAVTQSLPSASLSDDASTSFATMSHPGSNMSDKSLLDGPLSAVDTDSLAAGLADSLQNMQDLPFLSVDHSMMDWSDSDLINNLTCDPVSSTVNGVNSDRVMVDGSDEDTRVKQELGNVEDMYLRHTQNTVTSMLNLPAHTSPPTITRDSNNPNLGNLQSIADDIKPHVTHTLPSAGGGGGVTNHMDHVTPHLDLNGVGGSDDPAGTSGGMSLEMCDWLDAMMPDSENSTVGVGSSPSSSIATTSSGDGGGGMCTALPSDQIIDSGTSGRPPSATVAANGSTAAVVALDDNQTNNNVNFSMLTPKTEDVLELFNMEEEDLYAQTDLGSSLTFEKALDTSHTAN